MWELCLFEYSIIEKKKSLFDFMVSENIDVFALTETWLCCGDNAVLNELLPPGYDIRHGKEKWWCITHL